LKTELPTYLALASGIAVDIEPTVWWKQNKAELPHWSHAFTEVVLIQPSSAAAERVFSLEEQFQRMPGLGITGLFRGILDATIQ
jgi:hypothetical protein